MASRQKTSSKKGSSKSEKDSSKGSRPSLWSKNRVTMFVLIVLSWILGLIILFSFGMIGVLLKEMLELIFGSFGLVLIVGIMICGLLYLWKMGSFEMSNRIKIGLIFFSIFWMLSFGLVQTQTDNPASALYALIASLTDFSTLNFHSSCGLAGALLAWLFTVLFSKTGALVFDLAFLFLAVILLGWKWWKHFLTDPVPHGRKAMAMENTAEQSVNPFLRPSLFGRLKAWANEGIEEEDEQPKPKKRPPRLPYGRAEQDDSYDEALDPAAEGIDDGYGQQMDDGLREDVRLPETGALSSEGLSGDEDLFEYASASRQPKKGFAFRLRHLFQKESEPQPEDGQEIYLSQQALSMPAQDPFDFAMSEDDGDDSLLDGAEQMQSLDDDSDGRFGSERAERLPVSNPSQSAADSSSAPAASMSSRSKAAPRRRAAPSRHAPFGVAPDQAGVLNAAGTALSSAAQSAAGLAGENTALSAAAAASALGASAAIAQAAVSAGHSENDAAQTASLPADIDCARADRNDQPSLNSPASAEQNMGMEEPDISNRRKSKSGRASSKPKTAQPTLFDDEMSHDQKDGSASVDYSNYRLPPLSLLQEPRGAKRTSAINAKKAKEQGERLIAILEQFGVEATLGEIHIGPSVTEFEVIPGQGVRVNAFVNLQSDIKLALAAKDIRVEAPIPGKSAVGIEVPNEEKTTVCMKDLISRIPDKYDDQPLAFTLGKDLMGDNIYGRLDTMPHLLIAGATGSGKSVCVNAVICSLLLRTRPDEVKLLLVDPKKVEFTPYNGIPHLLAPVITDAAMASGALKLIVDLMDERYSKFETLRVRNLAGYNEYVRRHPSEDFEVMPRIVVIIDELADLMLAASKDVEASIQRITQLARAAGIHLIVATQRPSVNVITGVIKANIPSRIAFMVSSRPDSRTILDQSGAEKLLGYGDMLFLDNGASSPKRIQGVFIQDQEVEAICDYVRKQGQPQYEQAFLALKESRNVAADDDSFEEDPLYNEVRNFVIVSNKASTSLIQRRFRIGYGRAARILDQLEANRIIGPAQGTRPRAVLVCDNEEEEGEY